MTVANVQHLGTLVEGRLSSPAAERARAGRAPCSRRRPWAAIRGTAALAMIAELEDFDRGRYGGPVGLGRRRRQRAVGGRHPLRRDRRAAGPALRRRRRGGRQRPRRRAGRDPGQVPGHAVGHRAALTHAARESRRRTLRCSHRARRDLLGRRLPVVLHRQAALRAGLAEYEDADDVEIVWKPFQLDPRAPTEPTPALDAYARKFGGPERPADHRPPDRDRPHGGPAIDFGIAQRANTFDAHRLLWLAEREGDQDAVKERLLRAYFTEGVDVADHAELARLADRGRPAGRAGRGVPRLRRGRRPRCARR